MPSMVPVSRTARIALVTDWSTSPVDRRSPSHFRTPKLLEKLRDDEGLPLDMVFVGTEDVADARLDECDGVWLLPGSPYHSEAGAVEAVRIAREHDVPFMGTCGGFQHALMEYAKHICGLADVGHAEQVASADNMIIIELACSLFEQQAAIEVMPDTLAGRSLGATRAVEKFRCSYGANPEYVETLRAHGMHFTGQSDEGDVRIAELPGNRFFMATLFQPELAGEDGYCHPIVRAFASAAIEHAGAREAVRQP